MDDPHTLTSLAALQELYDAPSERVRLKQIDRLGSGGYAAEDALLITGVAIGVVGVPVR